MEASPYISSGIEFVPYFKEQIEIQRHAIDSFKKWMFALVAVGVATVVLVLLFSSKLSGLHTQVFGIGGAFIGALSAFPYREISPRRAKISSYDLLRRNFENFNRLPAEDQQKLKELAVEVIKSNIK